ncbi:MAG: cation:proton antiporter [Rariglobus sp.]
MSHDVPLIAILAVGFGLAFVLGFMAQKLRLPPLVGYLLAGVAIGPFTPGFVADAGLAAQLAEVGVMLLMFGVGLHFSVADLMAVKRIAVPGAVVQIGAATAIGVALAHFWGWSLGGGLVLGLSLSVASTVVLLKALEERNGVSTPNGRIAVGWLIVEDLAMVLVLVLLPAMAEMLGGSVGGDAHGSEHGLLLTLAITLAKVGCFVGIAMIFGPRVVPWLLRQVARTGSRELFTLSVLAVALGVAFGSAKLFGVSFALGAFFAGVVLSESELSHKAAEKSLPLQDAFAVIFFVSVGMLFDPGIILREPGMVLAVLALIVVGKSIIAMGIVLVLGYPMSTALSVSAALAQVGEFSFILAGMGIAYGLLPPEGLSLILAGALLSITLNPLVFAGTDFLTARIRASAGLRKRLEENRAGPLTRLEAELETVRANLAKKADAHKTFTPEELVRKFPFFAALPDDQREALILHFHPRSAQPGERIIRAGDKADGIYFISSGQAEVAVAGRRIRLRAGDFFGEMALLSGKPRSADVTALDFSQLMMLSQADFRAFARKYPDIRKAVAALAEQRGELNQQWLDAGADEDLSPA